MACPSPPPSHEPGLPEDLGRDLAAGGEDAQPADVDDLHLRRLHPSYPVAPRAANAAAIGDALDERKLPAFEAGPHLAPGSRLLALVSPAGGIAHAGCAPAADAAPPAAGSAGRPQFTETGHASPLQSTPN